MYHKYLSVLKICLWPQSQRQLHVRIHAKAHISAWKYHRCHSILSDVQRISWISAWKYHRCHSILPDIQRILRISHTCAEHDTDKFHKILSLVVLDALYTYTIMHAWISVHIHPWLQVSPFPFTGMLRPWTWITPFWCEVLIKSVAKIYPPHIKLYHTACSKTSTYKEVH